MARTPDIDSLARELARPERPERLSPDARGRLFAAVTQGPEPGALAALFLPIRRMALAATLPAIVLGVLLVGVAGRTPTADPSGSTRIVAEKIGGEVVFRIANGGTAHRVVRSSSPASAASEVGAVAVRGEYRDSLDAESSIVFYRID